MLPNTWIGRNGNQITRPAGMSDSLWRAVLEGEGWTPGALPPAASPGSPSGGSVSPQEAMSMIAQALAAGGTLFSSIYGAVTGVNNQTGVVQTQAGPVGANQLGGLYGNLGGQRGSVDTTVDPEKDEGFLGLGGEALIPIALGGMVLLFLVLDRPRR